MTFVGPSIVEEIRLTSFKSFTNAVFPIGEMTLVVGRNGSGKSNALDGLWALACLASREDVRKAFDGEWGGHALRGGAAACAPFDDSTYSLGCTVRTGARLVQLDVTVEVEPAVHIVAERLTSEGQVLLATDPAPSSSAEILAAWDDGAGGDPQRTAFGAGRLLAAQVIERVPPTPAGRRVRLAAAQVLAALRSVIVFDPAPDEMRQYVPRRDIPLRRTAGNLSASVASLLSEPSTALRLTDVVRGLNEQDMVAVTMSKSDVDDVMLTLVERIAGRPHRVPARVLSDGLLRALAVVVALLQAPEMDTALAPSASHDTFGQGTLVIEDLGNGLHPSHARLLMGLVRDDVHRRQVRVLATTHSPAVLDALTGDEHRCVVVCERDRDGRSHLRRLVDLPNYVDFVAAGTIGRAAEQDCLRTGRDPTRSPSETFAEVVAGPS